MLDIHVQILASGLSVLVRSLYLKLYRTARPAETPMIVGFLVVIRHTLSSTIILHNWEHAYIDDLSSCPGAKQGATLAPEQACR